ncbi:MAG: hypothetical protein LUH11_03095 [Candidatus Gastranaerophilales bacterium]|nr:hypothetical protein [Candidatus Gastranaerophilales bacterium]
MQVNNNISFGSVIAVSGKPQKVNKVSSKLYTQVRLGDIIMKDVTSVYKNASSSGMLAQSAQNGDKVEIYITGNDVDKVKNKALNWDTLGGILSNLSTYFNLQEKENTVDKVVNYIYKN